MTRARLARCQTGASGARSTCARGAGSGRPARCSATAWATSCSTLTPRDSASDSRSSAICCVRNTSPMHSTMGRTAPAVKDRGGMRPEVVDHRRQPSDEQRHVPPDVATLRHHCADLLDERPKVVVRGEVVA